jgi:hypothetical protein
VNFLLRPFSDTKLTQTLDYSPGTQPAPPAELVVRFDDGYAQTAYLERGVLNITRPIYYHYVDFTFISKDLPEVERYSGRSASDSLSTYKQAMQCLLTFGLAKPIDSLTSVTLPP